MMPNWRKDYLRYKSYFLNVLGRYKERADIKVYMELLLSLATVSIFAVFALKPTILTIAGLIKEIETKRATLAKMEEKIQNLSKAQTLYDRERSRINLLLTAIPPIAKPDIFTRQVGGLSSSHQTQILGVTTDKDIAEKQNPSDKEEKSFFSQGVGAQKYTIRLSTQLDEYQNLSDLLSDFESLRIPAKIDSAQIATSIENENKVLVLTIQGKLPFFQRGK